jgi:hypothetical protein
MPNWDDIIADGEANPSSSSFKSDSSVSSPNATPAPSVSWEKKIVNIDRFGSFSYFQEKQNPDKIFVEIDEFANLPLLSKKVASDIFP